MNFLIHGLTLTLASFLVINVALSAAVAWTSRRDLHSESATFWFLMRVLPAAAAFVFMAAVFVPSYWRYEPRETAEGFDVTLTSFAVIALAMIVVASARGVAAWRRASERARVWMATSRPLALAGTGMPAFEVEVDTPIMALVGVWQPRLLVTRGLINALTPEELAASVAHELGHSRAWDNLKRLAMCAAPDFLSATTARRFERRWASAAEHAADHLNGDNSAAARCALASALVKVARLTPAEPPAAEPISTLVGGGEIASRVRRLLEDNTSHRGDRRGSQRVCAAGAAGVAAIGAAGAAYGPILQTVHNATEVLVHFLP
jgi:beta-lactamase regulating signal transducer with metallopeptidase domain